MKRVVPTLLMAGVISIAFQVQAQGGPPKDNMIDGERFPDGYTPMEIRNGVYPRAYSPDTERLGPSEMRVTALGTGMPAVQSSAHQGPQICHGPDRQPGSLPV